MEFHPLPQKKCSCVSDLLTQLLWSELKTGLGIVPKTQILTLSYLRKLYAASNVLDRDLWAKFGAGRPS